MHAGYQAVYDADLKGYFDSIPHSQLLACVRVRVVDRSVPQYAGYVMVFTTVPASHFSTAEVLEWYRVRWQIELVFKRLKTLAELPAEKPPQSRTVILDLACSWPPPHWRFSRSLRKK